MKIVLNFVPLKSGGGVQVALDFINSIGVHGKEHKWYLVASKDTPFEELTLPDNCNLIRLVGRNIFKRIWFEEVQANELVASIQPDIIYTQFGPHWSSVKGTHVVGCAYSNLFYPDVDFWKGYSLFALLKRKLYDVARINRLRKADFVIFETEDLADRAVKVRGFEHDRVNYVLPTVSANIGLEVEHEKTKLQCAGISSGFNLCLISGYAKNKNIETLVRAAAVIKNRHGRGDVRFVFTLPVDHEGARGVMKMAGELGVTDQVINIGPIPFEGCAEVYRRCDAAILPATLESFSNNIAEAWAMEKPLFITDMDWSRSLCKDGAIYIDHNNPEDIATKIINFIDQGAGDVVKKGTHQLSTYPSSEERFKGYMDIIYKAAR